MPGSPETFTDKLYTPKGRKEAPGCQVGHAACFFFVSVFAGPPDRPGERQVRGEKVFRVGSHGGECERHTMTGRDDLLSSVFYPRRDSVPRFPDWWLIISVR